METQNILYPVEKIVDRRMRQGKVEYRVRWKNYSSDTDSWEPSKSLSKTCPTLIKNFNENLKNLNHGKCLSVTSTKLTDLPDNSNGIIRNVTKSSSLSSATVNQVKSKTSKKMARHLDNNKIDERPQHKSHNPNLKLSSHLVSSSNSDSNTRTSSPRLTINSRSCEIPSNHVVDSMKFNELKRKFSTNQIDTVKKLKISPKESMQSNGNHIVDDTTDSLNKINRNTVNGVNISSSNKMNLPDHFSSESFCLRRLPYQKHRDLENVESVEGLVLRRKSARQMGGSNRFREIIVRQDIAAGFTEISLFNKVHAFPNCFTVKILNELSAALKQAINDSSRVLLLTSVGKVFSSGLDLASIVHSISTYRNFKNSRFSTAQLANPLSHFQYLQDLTESLKRFLLQLLNFPKPIVVGVNGPAIGLGCAILPLCDLIYATESSSFYLPYTTLCQFPEGGTSVTLSMLIGMPAANQLLLGGRRWSAKEALNRGLISEIIFSEKFKLELYGRCKKLANVPSMSMETMKCMLRYQFKEKIEFSINVECKKLLDIWRTNEFQNNAQHFIDKQLPDLLV